MPRAVLLLELVRLQFLSVARDRMALFWSVVFPIVLLLIFGSVYAGGGGKEKLTVYGAAVDQWGRDLLKALEKFNVTVKPVEPPADPERYVAEQSLRLRGPITLVVAGGNNVTIYSTSAVEAGVLRGLLSGALQDMWSGGLGGPICIPVGWWGGPAASLPVRILRNASMVPRVPMEASIRVRPVANGTASWPGGVFEVRVAIVARGTWWTGNVTVSPLDLVVPFNVTIGQGGNSTACFSPPIRSIHISARVVGGSGEVGRMGPASVALLLLLAIALQSGVVLVPSIFAWLYQSGLLKRLALSPLGRLGLLSSMTLAVAIFGVASAAMELGVAWAVYRVNISWLADPVVWAACVLVYLFGAGLGFLIYTAWVTFGEQETSTTAITVSTFLSLAFLSGIFMPYELLPSEVRAVMQHFPTTQAALILRAYQVGYVDPAAFLYPAAASLAVFAVGAALFRPLKRP